MSGGHYLWRCRACGVLNDFQGIEEYMNAIPEGCKPDPRADWYEITIGEETSAFCMLRHYTCVGCGISISPPPMWFVTDSPEDAPVFIETLYERVALS